MTAFNPPLFLKNRHVQSMLASTRFRRPMVLRHARPLLEAARERLIDCGQDVTMQGFLSSHERSNGETPRLAVLIHGWEGSSDSLYVVSAASYLFEHGYDVFRLNLRDHGATHHLNRELFHSCRIEEAVGAIGAVCDMFPAHRVFLGGFSLGGNFALRIAVRAPALAIPLQKVVAVCPVLVPANTMEALETGWFGYRRHFKKKWRRSLLRKQSCWPDAYDFGNLDELKTLTQMTHQFVREHTEFADSASYFEGYAIIDDVLSDLDVPAHIIVAEDDPVIPVDDLAALARPRALGITVTAHGGHCGFIENFQLQSWADKQILRQFEMTGSKP